MTPMPQSPFINPALTQQPPQVEPDETPKDTFEQIAARMYDELAVIIRTVASPRIVARSPLLDASYGRNT